MATSVASYVRELLYEQDCVVIPDFGGFIAHFLSAGFQTANGGFQPPKKRIAFNEVLKFDDGLLSNYIAYRQQLTRGQSLELIGVFVREIKDTLASNSVYYFEHVGVFTLNKEGKLLFEPSENTNFYAEGYGLATLFLHPTEVKSVETANPIFPLQTLELSEKLEIEAIEEAPQPSDEPKTFVLPALDVEDSQVISLPQRSFPWWLAACVAFLILCGLSLFLFKPDNTKQVSLSSLNPLFGLVEKFGNYNLSEQPNQFPIQANSQAYSDSVVKSLVSPHSNPFFAKQVLPGEDTFNTNEMYKKVDSTISPRTENVTAQQNVHVLNQSKPRYWVIAGAFESRRNANKLKSHLEKYGYRNVAILPPSDGEHLFKVATNGFKSFNNANRASSELTQLLGEEAWVMRVKRR